MVMRYFLSLGKIFKALMRAIVAALVAAMWLS